MTLIGMAMADKRPRRNAEDFARRFGWETEDITVRNPAGEVIDISKKPEEKESTNRDVVPKPPDEN